MIYDQKRTIFYKKTPTKDWSWVYIVTLALVAVASYHIDNEIVVNQSAAIALHYN